MILGLENPGLRELVNNQPHDTSYPGSEMLGLVKPGSSKRVRLQSFVIKASGQNLVFLLRNKSIGS